ncbi:MAG: BACON domain-containing protein [Prevotella sp.]|nr:BACON domain-containing protein [Prevotella sp.]
MKKILLTLGGVILCLTAGAQSLKTFEASEVKEESALDLSAAKALPEPQDDPVKPNCHYMRMKGVYYFAMSEKRYTNSTYAFLAVPNFQEISFPSYYVPSAVSNIQWKYVDPSVEYNMFNPQLTSTDSILTVTYKYDKRNTQIEAPTFTASNGTADSTYKAADYMMVGGVYSTTNGGKYYWGNNSPAITSSVSYSSTRYCTNKEDVRAYWEGNKGYDTGSLVVKGFSEFFKIPDMPYYLQGAAVYGRCNSGIKGNAKLTITRCSYYTNSYNFAKPLETLATATISKNDITPTSTGGSAYFLDFKNLKDAEGNPIDGLTVSSAIMVTISFDDSETQFMPYFRIGQSINNDVHNHMCVDYKKNGTEFTDQFVPVNLSYAAGPGRSFCIYLNADYDWIKHIGSGDKPYTGKTFSDVPASGDAQSITLHASEEYQDALGLTTNWNVEAPDWITVALTDNRDDESNYLNTTNLNVTVKPNTGEARDGQVVIKYKAATYSVTIKQLGVSTAITTVNADQQNDADAPAYNLAGQRVGSSVKGIIIKNGKKYVVK